MTITHAPAPPAAEVNAALPTEAPDHERVLITRGPRSGLTIIVAVHSTRLGQALGGARLTVTDVAESKRALADELGAAWVEPHEAHLVEADMFVPCGLGGVLTHEVVESLRVRAVVGAANNQLASRDVAGLLTERGIVWAPDFVVNAGGVIYLDVASEPGADQAALDARIAGIGDTVASVLRSAAARVVVPCSSAERSTEATVSPMPEMRASRAAWSAPGSLATSR